MTCHQIPLHNARCFEWYWRS